MYISFIFKCMPYNNTCNANVILSMSYNLCITKGTTLLACSNVSHYSTHIPLFNIPKSKQHCNETVVASQHRLPTQLQFKAELW